MTAISAESDPAATKFSLPIHRAKDSKDPTLPDETVWKIVPLLLDSKEPWHLEINKIKWTVEWDPKADTKSTPC